MKYDIIINPMGGAGQSVKAWASLQREFDNSNIGYQEYFTKGTGDAIDIAKRLTCKGSKRIIAVGGDGTANEVANGILQAQDEGFGTETAMTLFSSGTGNDWVREHRISRRAVEFVKSLQDDRQHIQDVGLIDYYDENYKQQSRYFINVAGLAYDAFVLKATEIYKKTGLASKLYLLHVFKNLLKYKPEKVRIRADDKDFTKTVYTINIGQCRYSGGNMQLVPHAVYDSGKLAVTMADSMPKWEVVLLTPKFYNGSLLNHPNVTGFECDRIEIRSLNNKEVMIEADGEFLGYTPVNIRNCSKKLKIFAVESV